MEKNEQDIERLKKDLQDAQWYLGEERAHREQAERTIKDTQQHVHDLEQQLHNMRAHAANLQKELQDAQWYLGEERSRRQQLENQLKSIKHE